MDGEDTNAAITTWVEGNLGGTVRHIERQARWRPVWWVSLEQDDEIKELCVRGDRIDSPSAFPLEHEMAFQSILQDNGIPVARVHGSAGINRQRGRNERVLHRRSSEPR